MSYEIWKKDDIGKRNTLPADRCYLLDTAMESAKKLSQGSTKRAVWNPKGKTPGMSYDGANEEIDVPNAYAVIERGDKQSRVRGWGIGGQWKDARDCKRCSNSGQDPNFYGDVCSSCKGSSYRPKV